MRIRSPIPRRPAADGYRGGLVINAGHLKGTRVHRRSSTGAFIIDATGTELRDVPPGLVSAVCMDGAPVPDTVQQPDGAPADAPQESARQNEEALDQLLEEGARMVTEAEWRGRHEPGDTPRDFDSASKRLRLSQA